MRRVTLRAMSLLLLPCFLPRLHAEVPSAIAIKDAHVVTVSGADLPKGTVVLRNGLIEDVGVTVTIPADAWVLDGVGLTVYPGFIDALSTWGIPAAPAATAARAPSETPATPASAASQPERPHVHGPDDRPQTYSFERAADLVSPSDSRLQAARAAGFTTSATFPNRGILEGLGAMIDLAGESGRDMVVAQPVGQQIVFRYGGGGMGRTFPASLMGNIAYVRQLYLDLDHYRQARDNYAQKAAGKRRPEYDHDLEGLMESPRILLPADEVQQIDRMLNFGNELKVPFALYGLHEAYKRVDQLKQANVPVLVSLKWPEKPKDQDPDEVPNYRELLMRDQAPAVPAMFAKAGVKFAFFSDGVSTAPDLKKALKKAIDAGLPPAEAIKALTLTPAEIYGLSDRLGSIEKGKIANIVLTRGDPFDDASTVEYLFIDGKQYEPSKDLQHPKKPNGIKDAAQPGATDEAKEGGVN